MRGECSIVFVMGAACCGKTTLIDAMVSNYTPEANPSRHRDVVGVHVGRVLRAKYGADAFRGQAAPEEFEREAIQLVMTSIENTLSHYSHSGRKLNILVDGQPRSRKQARELLKFVHGLGGVRRSAMASCWSTPSTMNVSSVSNGLKTRPRGDSRCGGSTTTTASASSRSPRFSLSTRGRISLFVQTDKGTSDLIRRTLCFMEFCESELAPEGV